jgi:3-phosphoshikimate 1-carboxyvinyltransferase
MSLAPLQALSNRYNTISTTCKGDARFASVLGKMGADVEVGENSITVSRRPEVQLVGIDEDCGDIPDVAMTLAIVGVFATGWSTVN